MNVTDVKLLVQMMTVLKVLVAPVVHLTEEALPQIVVAVQEWDLRVVTEEEVVHRLGVPQEVHPVTDHPVVQVDQEIVVLGDLVEVPQEALVADVVEDLVLCAEDPWGKCNHLLV